MFVGESTITARFDGVAKDIAKLYQTGSGLKSLFDVLITEDPQSVSLNIFEPIYVVIVNIISITEAVECSVASDPAQAAISGKIIESIEKVERAYKQYKPDRNEAVKEVDREESKYKYKQLVNAVVDAVVLVNERLKRIKKSFKEGSAQLHLSQCKYLDELSFFDVFDTKVAGPNGKATIKNIIRESKIRPSKKQVEIIQKNILAYFEEDWFKYFEDKLSLEYSICKKLQKVVDEAEAAADILEYSQLAKKAAIDTRAVLNIYFEIQDLFESFNDSEELRKEFKSILKDIANLPDCSSQFKVYYLLIKLDRKLIEFGVEDSAVICDQMAVSFSDMSADISKMFKDHYSTSANECDLISVDTYVWYGNFEKIISRPMLERSESKQVDTVLVLNERLQKFNWQEISEYQKRCNISFMLAFYLYRNAAHDLDHSGRNIVTPKEKALQFRQWAVEITFSINPWPNCQPFKQYLQEELFSNDFASKELLNLNWRSFDEISKDLSLGNKSVIATAVSRHTAKLSDVKSESVIVNIDELLIYWSRFWSVRHVKKLETSNGNASIISANYNCKIVDSGKEKEAEKEEEDSDDEDEDESLTIKIIPVVQEQDKQQKVPVRALQKVTVLPGDTSEYEACEPMYQCDIDLRMAINDRNSQDEANQPEEQQQENLIQKQLTVDVDTKGHDFNLKFVPSYKQVEQKKYESFFIKLDKLGHKEQHHIIYKPVLRLQQKYNIQLSGSVIITFNREVDPGKFGDYLNTADIFCNGKQWIIPIKTIFTELKEYADIPDVDNSFPRSNKHAIKKAHINDDTVEYDVNCKVSILDIQEGQKPSYVSKASVELGGKNRDKIIHLLQKANVEQQTQLAIKRTVNFQEKATTLSFDEYYCPLLLETEESGKTKPKQVIFNSEKIENISNEGLSAAEKPVRMFLFGDAGNGKTTLLDYWQYYLAMKSKRKEEKINQSASQSGSADTGICRESNVITRLKREQLEKLKLERREEESSGEDRTNYDWVFKIDCKKLINLIDYYKPKNASFEEKRSAKKEILQEILPILNIIVDSCFSLLNLNTKVDGAEFSDSLKREVFLTELISIFRASKSEKRVLLMVDGIDELPNSLLLRGDENPVEKEARSMFFEGIATIWQGIRHVSLIVSSRRYTKMFMPDAMEELFRFKKEEACYIQGFSPLSAEQYIKRYFNPVLNSELVKEDPHINKVKRNLIELLFGENRQYLCNPAILDGLCQAWRIFEKESTQKQIYQGSKLSVTDYLNAILVHLLVRYVQKNNIGDRELNALDTAEKIEEKCKREITYLEHFALVVLVFRDESTVLIRYGTYPDSTLKYLKSPTREGRVKDISAQFLVGFITTAEDFTKTRGVPKGDNPLTNYPQSFQHTIFQEFFAARFLVKCLCGIEHDFSTALSCIGASNLKSEEAGKSGFISLDDFIIKYVIKPACDDEFKQDNILNFMKELLSAGRFANQIALDKLNKLVESNKSKLESKEEETKEEAEETKKEVEKTEVGQQTGLLGSFMSLFSFWPASSSTQAPAEQSSSELSNQSSSPR